MCTYQYEDLRKDIFFHHKKIVVLSSNFCVLYRNDHHSLYIPTISNIYIDKTVDNIFDCSFRVSAKRQQLPPHCSDLYLTRLRFCVPVYPHVAEQLLQRPHDDNKQFWREHLLLRRTLNPAKHVANSKATTKNFIHIFSIT